MQESLRRLLAGFLGLEDQVTYVIPFFLGAVDTYSV